jgi:hypothetical protein
MPTKVHSDEGRGVLRPAHLVEALGRGLRLLRVVRLTDRNLPADACRLASGSTGSVTALPAIQDLRLQRV